jgi:hypothetical protein
MQNIEKAQLDFYARALKNAILFSSATKAVNFLSPDKNEGLSKSPETSSKVLSRGLKTSFT